MRTEASAHAALPPREAWARLAELDRLAQWAPDVTASPSDPLRVGAIRRARLRKPAYGKDTLVERVVAVDPGRSFTYDIEDGIGPLAGIRTTWTVEPAGAGGGSLVRVASEVALSGPARFASFLVRRAWRKQLQALADAFAAWAPTATAATGRRA